MFATLVTLQHRVLCLHGQWQTGSPVTEETGKCLLWSLCRLPLGPTSTLSDKEWVGIRQIVGVKNFLDVQGQTPRTVYLCKIYH